MQEQQLSLENRKYKLICLLIQLEDMDTLAAIEALLSPLTDGIQVGATPEVEFLETEVVDVADCEDNTDELTDEMKEFLLQRVENHNKAPEKAMTWEEAEQHLLKKFDYEV
jgi:hypothetical protein